MPSDQMCPECGTRFEGESGLCPRCLLQAGLEHSVSEATQDIQAKADYASTDMATFIAPIESSVEVRSGDKVSTGPNIDPDDPETAAGQTVRYFGEYELLQEIARGGMGVVWKARQTKLNRIVALKMILAGQLASEQDVHRFQLEAEAAANLDHIGIVPIFEIGEYRAQQFFSMGFIDGDSLAERVNDGPMKPREAASIVKQVAQAIAYAHERNVIHRDLKPANVLIDSDGQPKVTDFGLAKKTETDSGLTASGQILGTPAFMPPEQASGEIDNIGPLADVYSIGAILYNLVTGRPPFQSASAMDTLRQVLENEPVPPRQLNSALDEDLQTICLKCLEKRPDKRYASAQDLIDELNRYLNGEPIVARPIGRLERSWRWCRRKPALAGLAAVGAALLAVLSIGGPMVALQQRNSARRQAALKAEALHSRDLAEEQHELAEAARTKAEHERLRAEQARQLAERNAKQAETARTQAEASRVEAVVARDEVAREQQRSEGLLYATRISLAHREWLDGNPARAQELLTSCPAEKRNWEWHYLDGLTRSEEFALFPHTLPISVEFSPDDKSLFTRGLYDGWIRAWDIESQLESRYSRVPGLRSAHMIDNDRVLILAGDVVSVANSSTMKRTEFPGFGVAAQSAIMFDGGARIAAAYDDGTVAIYAFPSGEEVQRTRRQAFSDVEGNDRDSAAHTFNPSATLVAGAIKGRTVRVWDVGTGEARFDVSGHVGEIKSLAFSPDGKILASGDLSGGLFLTNVETGERLRTIRAHNSGVLSIAFNDDQTHLATASLDRTARVFDIANGSEVFVVRGHTHAVLSVDFDSAGERVATSSLDGTVRVWNIAHRITMAEEVREALGSAVNLGHSASLGSRILYPHAGTMSDAVTSPDGRFIATAAAGSELGDRQIRIWSNDRLAEVARFPASLGGLLHSLMFSADSQYLVVTSGGGGDKALRPSSVTVWNIESETVEHKLNGVPSHFARGALNADGTLLAVVFGNGSYGKLRIYSFPECKQLHDINVSGEDMSSLAFAHDSNILLTAGLNTPDIRVWDAQAGQELRSISAQAGGVVQLATDSSGNLAVGNIDSTVGVFNWKSGQQLGTLTGHNDIVSDFAFSPDGLRLLTTSNDETVKVWDLTTFSELLSFRDHRAQTSGADWSADGTTLVSASRNATVILRELQPPGEFEEAELSTWTTIFADDFNRSVLGDEWKSTSQNKWTLREGRAVGTMVQDGISGSGAPTTQLELSTMDLPREVDVSIDVVMQTPMFVQLTLNSGRHDQWFAPFVSSSNLPPTRFIGSGVLVDRGKGREAQLFSRKTGIHLEAGKTHRLRMLRNKDRLKFFLDGQLLAHTRIPTWEADMLTLGGGWSNVGDRLEFDNLTIRVPKSFVREREIRQQVNDWIDEAIVPDIVEDLIAQRIADTDEQKIAVNFLRGLDIYKSLSVNDIFKAIDKTVTNPDASDEDIQIAARLADFYNEKKPDAWWTWGKMALAWMRAGRFDDAIDRFDIAADRFQKEDGFVWPLVYAGQALTLHELGRHDEAEAAHFKLIDVGRTNWGAAELLAPLREELNRKVPVEVDPLLDELITMIIDRDKGYHYGRWMGKAYRNISPDFVVVAGRGPKPDQYDREFDRSTFRTQERIFGTAPAPKAQLFWDQVQFDHQDDTATIQLIAITKQSNSTQRMGRRYNFERRDGRWLITKLRQWHIDRRYNERWTYLNNDHWQKLDAAADALKPDDPYRPVALVAARRFEEAYENAAAIAENSTDRDTEVRAKNLVVLGNSAIMTGRFEEGIDALEKASQLDTTVSMPWFSTRLRNNFASFNSVGFGLDFPPNRDVMATGHYNGKVVIWDLNTQKSVQRVDARHDGLAVSDVAFFDGGQKFITAGWNNAVHIIDVNSGKVLHRLTGHTDQVLRVGVHPNGRLAVTASDDKTARVWDLTEAREVVSLSGHSAQVMGAAFSPRGDQIATASIDGTIRLWDPATGLEQAQIDAHEKGTSRVDWTPDGTRLVSSGYDGKVRLWNAESHEQIAEFDDHSAPVDVVRVSEDGRLAASGDRSGTICVWDLSDLKLLGILRGRDMIVNLRFHGGSLFSVGKDTVIREWDVDFSRSPLRQSLQPQVSSGQ